MHSFQSNNLGMVCAEHKIDSSPFCLIFKGIIGYLSSSYPHMEDGNGPERFEEVE